MAYAGHENTFCKSDCATLREHLGNGPMVDGRAMPTRSRATALARTEAQWERDGDAYKRLAKDGYQLQSLDGAADIEARATQKVELETGRIYGKDAKKYQMIKDGGTY